MRRGRVRVVLIVVAAVACERAPDDFARRRAGAALEHLAASTALPPQFGYGRPATPAEIQRIDIDVGPDGVGLPAGSGTAAGGAPIYAAKCAVCHGISGEGTAVGMPLVGRVPGDSFTFASAQAKERTKTIGNWWPYATTLYDYIHRAMPFDHPGSLAPDDVYSLVAFLLARNQIINEDFVIDAASLPRVQMPARDHFAPDDRDKSTRVR